MTPLSGLTLPERLGTTLDSRTGRGGAPPWSREKKARQEGGQENRIVGSP